MLRISTPTANGTSARHHPDETILVQEEPRRWMHRVDANFLTDRSRDGVDLALRGASLTAPEVVPVRENRIRRNAPLSYCAMSGGIGRKGA
jgi:hypothetical protein